MCVPGQELAVLERVAVDREGEQVAADAAVVEQRVALARAPVRDDRLALGARSTRNSTRSLRTSPPSRRSRRGPRRCAARPPPRRPAPSATAGSARRRSRSASTRCAASRRGWAAPPTSTTVSPAARQHPLGGEQRQVRVVLVVDRVVLAPSISRSRCGISMLTCRRRRRAPAGPWRSRRCRARGRTRCWRPPGRLAVLGATLAPVSSPRNRTSVGRPWPRPPRPRWRPARCRGSGCRGRHVLQEVAVVAGDLDHEGVLAEAEPVDRGVDEALGVRHPRVAVRREVGVVAEDVLGRDVRRQLDQQALRADPDVQRVEGLALVELVGREVALARRRHAEVDERVGELGPHSRHRGRLTAAPPSPLDPGRSSSSSRPAAISSRTRASRTKRGPSNSSSAAQPVRRMSRASSLDAGGTVHAG